MRDMLSELKGSRKVTVSAAQVATFRQTWPGCTLEGEITFEYESDGTLVGIDPFDPDDYDGENDRALLALSYDAAKGYGRLHT